MSEERILKIVRWQFDAVSHLILPYEAKFDDLESAPQKDWSPLCYEENANGDCDIFELQDTYKIASTEIKEHCKTCAWRKERR